MQKSNAFSLFPLVLAILMSPVSFAEEVLFTAKYEGVISGFDVDVTRSLKALDDDSFLLESKAKNAFGSIVEKSHFRLIDNVIQTLQFDYLRKVIGIKRNEKITFNWENKTAEYTNKQKPKKNTVHEVTHGILDPSLYQLQLQRDLFAEKENFSYVFVKQRRIKNLKFKITGKEAYKVRGTVYEAVKFERINVEDKKQTNVWIIPELNYQIARIQHIEKNGEESYLNLNSYQGSEKLYAKIYTKLPALESEESEQIETVETNTASTQ